MDVLGQPVADGDLDGAQRRVARFRDAVTGLDPGAATALRGRLADQHTSVGLAFAYTFATSTRRRLLAELDAIATATPAVATTADGWSNATAAGGAPDDLAAQIDRAIASGAPLRPAILTAEPYEAAPPARVPDLGMTVTGFNASHMAGLGGVTYFDLEFAEPKTIDEVCATLFTRGRPPPFSAVEAHGNAPTRTWTVGGPDYWQDAAKHAPDGMAFMMALRQEVRAVLADQLAHGSVARRDPIWFDPATRATVRQNGAPPPGSEIRRWPDEALPVYVWRAGAVWYRYDTVRRNLQAFHREPREDSLGPDLYNAWVVAYIEQGVDIADAMDLTVRDMREANIAMLGGFATALASAASFGRAPEPHATPRVRIRDVEPDVPAPSLRAIEQLDHGAAPPRGVDVDAPTPVVRAPEPATPTRAPDAPEPAQRAPEPTEAPNAGGSKRPPAAKKPKITKEEFRPCFLAGTLVMTPTGAVPIEGLATGDRVYTRLAGATAIGSVTARHGGMTTEIWRIDTASGHLRCTRHHQFAVVGRGWVPAVELRAGDRVEVDDGAPVELASICMVRVAATATYDVSVAPGASYFVGCGPRALLVHNGGAPYARTLYWFFGKLRARAGDEDGASVWRTTSRAEVNKLLEIRVKVDGRALDDPHGFATPDSLAKQGLVAPATPGDPDMELTKQGFSHHSVRPAANADPDVKLSEADLEGLNQLLEKVETTKTKPIALHGEC